MAEVISVSALNQYVKTLLDANDLLFDLALRGEIANFVQNARSGHCYFSLRDETSSVKAVMFRSDARRLGFRPEEGMKVIVRCRATLYERDGAFQVYVNDMFPDGIGSAQLAFEQLKAKLDREGLFAAERKKPLPRFPKCIGLVTSKTGAALQDIRNVIGRRWPAARKVNLVTDGADEWCFAAGCGPRDALSIEDPEVFPASPLSRQNMQAQLAGRQQQVEAVSGQLQTAAQKKQQDAGLRLRHAAALAATLNPYGVLARGYALVQDEKGRICAPDALREGQKMTLCGAVNRIHCTVDAVEGPNESTQEL